MAAAVDKRRVALRACEAGVDRASFSCEYGLMHRGRRQLRGPFKSGRPDWNECGATRLKPLAHGLRGALLERGAGRKRVQATAGAGGVNIVRGTGTTGYS
eukprot:174882-Prymnesium_polylepis.1